MKKIVDIVSINLLISAIASIFFVAESSLPNLDLSKILEALSRSCVVIAVDESGKESFSDLLATISDRAFENDDQAIFGRSSISDLFSDPKIAIKTKPPLKSDRSIDNGKSILIVLEKKPIDRTCLLTNGLVHKELKGGLFEGAIDDADSESILDFINKYCGTYRNLDGRLNAKGLRRESILKNLFSLDPKLSIDQKSPIDMKSIFEKCADRSSIDHDHHRNLKKFFYEGKCDRFETELPQCESIDGDRLTKEEFFENYLSKSKPVVVKNILKNVWTNIDRWTNDYFRDHFGDRRLNIKLTPTGEFEGVENISLWNQCRSERSIDYRLVDRSIDNRQNYCSSPMDQVPREVRKHLLFSKDLVLVRPADEEMTMNEFIDLIENRIDRPTIKNRFGKYQQGNLSAYLEYTPVGDNFVGFDEELPEMPFMKDWLKLDLLNMWLSNGNTLGKLHFDQYDNLLCQVTGKKRVILFEPHNNTRFYEGHIVEAKLSFRDGHFAREGIMENTALTMSPVDIENPNFERFPEFANAVPLNCTIESGDILFIPSFWWHEVQSYPDQYQKRNLAFNFWYEPFFSKEFPCADCKMDVNSLYRHLL